MWSLIGSPYIVTADVTIRQSISDSGNVPTLTIEPGVEVRFASGTGLHVGDDTGHGVLSAQGTQDAPITFTSNSAAPSPGDWKGIVINNSIDQWGTNLCTSGSCQASDYYASYDCTGAFDGNPDYYYHSQSNPNTHWVGYDFGSGNSRKVDRIKIYQYNGSHAEQFVIEGSNSEDINWDDKTWITFSSVDNGRGGWQTIDFNNDTAYRFVRVRSIGGYASPDYFVVWELEMYAAAKSVTTLEHSVVEYGGHIHDANIYLIEASPSIDISTIRHSASYGIYANDTESSPVITNNTITNNGSYPIRVGAMMNVSGNTITGNGIQAIEVFPEDIIHDTIWRNEGVTYIVTGDVTVRQSVSDSGNVPTLTIEPGVEVRFSPETGIYVGDDTGHGVLSAQGSQDAPITFTSNSATPSPGDWKGIVINKSDRWGANLCVNGLCEESDAYSGSLECSRAFDGNSNTYYHSQSFPNIHWIGYDFGSGNAHKVDRIKIHQYENGHNAQVFVVEGSNSSDESWDEKTWTILASVSNGHGGWQTVDFINHTEYRFVRVRSTDGYATPYYFVVWELEMYAAAKSVTTLEHSVVEYGGHTHDANIRLIEANLDIKYNSIRNSSHSGIYMIGEGCNNTEVTCNEIENNLYGIYTIENALPSIHHNNFANNQLSGLYNTGSITIIAEENWWGDTGGPGLAGDSVYGNVDYTPWLTVNSICASGPVPPPQINSVASPTNNPTPVISGTKAADSAILLNSQEIVGNTPETDWQYTVTLQSGENELIFAARDLSGNLSENVTLNILLDDIPPQSVEDLIVIGEGNGDTVILDWTGYDEALAGDIVSYRIYTETSSFTDVSGLAPVATVEAGMFTYTVENLIPGTTYYFAVVAEDTLGNFQATIPDSIPGVPVYFETAWNNNIKLFIHPADIDEDLFDFPILLHLSDNSGIEGFDASAVFTELSSDDDRKKIAIYGSDDKQCYAEIERWDSANKEAWLWVRVPEVSSTQGTVLTFCFDAAHSDNTTFVGDTGSTPAQNVWDENYEAVWHMAQDPAGDAMDAIKDSTSNANHATSWESMTASNIVEGQVGNGLYFGGTYSQYLSFSPVDTSAWTAEIIANPKDHTLSTDGYVVFDGKGIVQADSYWCLLNEDDVQIKGDELLLDSGFVNMAATYDGSSAYELYKNGSVNTRGDHASNFWRLDNKYFIARGSMGNCAEGIIDEVRISDINRSAAWIKATYHSSSDNLILFGTDEDTPPQIINTLSADGEGDGTTVFLSWFGYDETLAGDIASYRIYVDTDPFSDVSALTPVAAVDAGTFGFTVENLTEGTTYYFAVVAVDAAGNFQTTISSQVSGIPVNYETVWSHKLKLYIHEARFDEDLQDFPVLIHLSESSGMGGYDASAVFTELTSAADRKKIAVFTANSRPCYVEIERWDSANKEAWLWVRVPGVSSTQGTVLTFCFDAAHSDNTTFVGDTGSTPAQNVWDENYAAVWHMAQDPVGDTMDAIKDSTSNANHATSWGSMTASNLVEGQVGKALYFDDTDGQYLSFHPVDAMVWTAEVIADPKNFSLSGDGLVVFNGKGIVQANDYWSVLKNSSVHLKGDALLLDSGFVNIAASHDGDTSFHIYKNGWLNDNGDNPNTGWDLSGKHYIGKGCCGRGAEGIIDEVRISKIERSALWIKATYYSNFDRLIITGSDHDNLPPHAVEDLEISGEGNATTAVLDWSQYNESIDGDIASYRIYADTINYDDVSGLTPVGSVNGGTFTFTVENLTAETQYYFAVVPVDHHGNSGTQVTTVSRYQGPVISNLKIDGLEFEDGVELKNPALITLDASDESGISRVDFYIDENLIHSDEDGDPHFFFYLNVLTLQDGNHDLKIVTHDTLGNSNMMLSTFSTGFHSPIIVGSTRMGVGEQQTLSVMNHKSGKTYNWSMVSGGGNLSSSTGGGVGEQQILSVMNNKSGKTYTWSNLSGDENLGSSTGESVTFTAPESNPNCENPIIEVSTDSGSSRIEIGINAVFDEDQTAYVIVDDWKSPLLCNGEAHMCGEQCNAYCLKVDQYNCEGKLLVTDEYECREACGSYGIGCILDIYEPYNYTYFPIEWCLDSQPEDCTNCLVDKRSEDMKEAGCCFVEPSEEEPEDCDDGEDQDCCGKPDCKIEKHGNPISIYNGNNYETEEDIRFFTPNSNPLILKRSYNSRSKEKGALGYGWTHTYNITLDPSYIYKKKEYLKILDGTGRGTYFQYIGNGKYAGAFKEMSTVEKEGENFIWNRLDANTYSFNSEGKIIWIDDAIGNRTAFSYDADDRITNITDAASNRTIILEYNTDGLIQTVSGPSTAAIPNGVCVTYGYDENNNLTSVSYADGSGFDYTYNDPNDTHNMTEKRDKMGHLLSSWEYDDQDRAIDNFTRDGRGVSIEYVNDTEVKVTDAYGVTRTYTIGNIDGKKRVTDISGTQGCDSCGNDVVRMEYDRALRVIEVEYADGLINQYDDFDSRGNARIIKTGVGTVEEKTTTYTFHPDMDAKLSQAESSILGQGDKITIWDYDNDGNDTPNENPTRFLHRIIEKGFTKNPSWAVVSYEYVTSYAYNSKGQVISIDGPQPGTQDTITFTYNGTTGDLLSVTSPLVGTTTYSNYDAAGNKGRVTDPNGNAQVYTYDGKGRIKTITNEADGGTTTYDYNTAGELTQVTGFNGAATGFAYDTSYGRMTRTTDALGNYVQYAYDDQGNRTEKALHKSDDERTYQMRYNYQHPNQPGKLWKEINPDNTNTEYYYDASGNIQSIIDAKGKTTSYDYDSKKRLVQVTQPGNVVTAYTYDDNDNLISITDAKDHKTSYVYDDAGRMISTTSPDTGISTYAYDAAGNLISKTDAAENTITYTYDALNRLTGIYFPDSSQDITYTYDQGANGKGRLTGMADPSGTYVYAYDALGNLIKEEKLIEGVTYQTEYTYDSAGVLTDITYPNGRTASYQLDNAGRVVKVSTGKDGITDTVADNIGYLPFGPINNLTYGNGTVLSQTFDLLYRPEGIVAGAFQNVGYTVDPIGNITAITDNLDNEKNRSFQYDELNRLIEATGVFGTIDYAYDKVGNRLSRTIDDETDTYTYESGNNRLSDIIGVNPQTFTYDANGNTTVAGNQTLNYNQNDRLIKVVENSTVKGEYTYNGNRQRVKKVSSGETVIYHYDRFGNLIGESTVEGTFTREYIYLNSMRLAAFASESTHNEIIVTVTTDDGLNLAGLKVYAFTETGSYTGKYAVTDEFGKAEFAISEFSEGSYKFRTDYMSFQFWSEIVTIPGAYSVDVEIEEETTILAVTRGGEVQTGVKVYLFNANGSYLGLYKITDENGEVTFDLPAGMSFKFRADTLGSQYFSDTIEIVSGEPNYYSIDVGGCNLVLTVDKGDSIPLTGVKAYLFKESGSYLGLWDLTDEHGAAGFEVSSGRYKIRVDYLGYQFWSKVIDTDALLADVLSLPHHDVTITVVGDHNGDIQPRENLKTYLFTPTGSYLGRYEVTDNQGLAIFNLPEKEYKVRVDYLSQQFWSEGFNSVDKTVTIDEGIAEVTVTSSGFPIEGVKTYVFNGTESYLGLYGTSDSDGKTLFRLPAGVYNFRADYMGNQYLSGVTTIIPDIDNPIPISTGGGAFIATILKGPGEPLVGVKCYLFNESGSYLGKYGTTNGSGEVSYDISDGGYKIRIDCLGYQFWTDVFNIPGPLSITHTVTHNYITITVACDYDGNILPGENLKAYLFTPSGSYLGQYQVTDNQGEAVFNLPEEEYKIRADYLSQQFWSDVFNSTDTVIDIEEGMAEIEILQGSSPLSNVKVYAFNNSDAYLGLYETTDADGKTAFRLPAATYRFRADHQGSQYWATETILPHLVNPIQLSTGGGSFELTVEKETGVPMTGVKVYVFSPAGSYLGMYDQTDDQGKATFDLSDGAYMFRVDYLGYKFWTEVYAVPETLSEILSIPHQDVTVTVNKVYGSDVDPIENIKAYLFKASGSYMGKYATTDADGQVTFSLPDKDYKVRADYLGSQYWSEVIFQQDEDIDIDHGKVNIHVTNLGEDIENAKVYLFTETGSYLGKYENTDSSGSASFTLPVKLYKFRVDYSGSQYWSGEITPLPHGGELDIDLALDPLALNLTNNPKPVRFDGVPIEYQPDGIMLASIGSLTGILTQSIVAQTPEPKIYYYINDHLGTPMKVIDENNTVAWSADYKPFGETDITVDTFKNNFRFPGQYYDQESQLHYNYHRYYQPQIGRYLRADPIGLLGGLNLYAYVIGNPINAADPSGLWLIPLIVNIGPRIAPYLVQAIPYIPAAWNNYEKTFSPWSPGIPEIIDGGKSFRDNYNRWKKRRERKNICETDSDEQAEGIDPYELTDINERAERLVADRIYKELRNEMEKIRRK